MKERENISELAVDVDTAYEQTLANLRLEGLEPSTEALELMQKIRDRKITVEEAVEQTKARYCNGGNS